MEQSKSRRRAPDERPEQLLDAAERVLLDRGLGATTVADVAEAAGVAKGTLYLYFDSKDALLAGLRARHLSRFTAAVDASVSVATASPATRLDRFVVALFEFSVANQALHRLLFHEAGFREEDAFAGASAVLERLLSDGVADGSFAPRDPAIAANFLLHGLHGVLVAAMHAPESRRRRSFAEAHALARASLGGNERGQA